SSMNARWIGCGRSGDPSPSNVVISAPATVLTGVTQERTARPRTMTVQKPHCPRPQPNFGPLNWRSSLRTYRSGVAGSTSTVCGAPLTFRGIRLILPHPTFVASAIKRKNLSGRVGLRERVARVRDGERPVLARGDLDPVRLA